MRLRAVKEDDGPVEADKVIQSAPEMLAEDRQKEATNERVTRLRTILNDKTAGEIPRTINLLEVYNIYYFYFQDYLLACF